MFSVRGIQSPAPLKGSTGGGVSAMEEKYLEERDRNILLKRKTNEQEDTIKRLYTKIQMIEETLRRRGAKGLDNSGVSGKGGRQGCNRKAHR